MVAYRKNLIIVSAPSGAGKSTLCNMALDEFPQLKDSISYTTRAPRDGETDGNPYFFISQDKFDNLIKHDFFAEWACVHTKCYGTSHQQLEEIWASGHTAIMDVDVVGARNLKAKYPQAVTIFIMPPSLDALRKRIEGRDKGKTNDFETRLINAQLEMKEAPNFQHVVVNEEIGKAYLEFKKIIEAIAKNR